ADRRRRGDPQAFPPPRCLDCARARQYRLRGQNPPAQPRAHPGQAGRAVPTLLTAIPALPRGGTTTSVTCLPIVFTRRGVARHWWHEGGRRGRLAFWRNSASPRAVIAQGSAGGDLKELAEATQRHRA